MKKGRARRRSKEAKRGNLDGGEAYICIQENKITFGGKSPRGLGSGKWKFPFNQQLGGKF